MQVILDRDLAQLYGVETRVLNQAVKRNAERFPSHFMFRLAKDEVEFLRSHFVILNGESDNKRGKHSKFLPHAFTEQGVSMLSAVLKSKTAIIVSIKIIDAFVSLRKFLSQNAQIFTRLDNVERKQIEHQLKTDKNFTQIFRALDDKSLKPKQGIFFDGQIFDAYKFVCDLLGTATSDITLIDNYIDENTLMLFAKCQNIKIEIYTKKIDKKLQLDLQKYNSQYSPIQLKIFRNAHDRFLIIDKKEIYHFGASLKDLGKKWFAFSRFQLGAVEILQKLK